MAPAEAAAVLLQAAPVPRRRESALSVVEREAVDRNRSLPYRKGKYSLEGKQPADLTDEVRKNFFSGDHVYIGMYDKIGDMMQVTGFVNGLCAARQKFGAETPITLMVPSPSMRKLLAPYAKKYGLEVLPIHAMEAIPTAENLIAEKNEKNALIVEMDIYENEPFVGKRGKNDTVIVRDLFVTLNALHTNANAGTARYANFTEDFLGLKRGTLDAKACVPMLPLPDKANDIYAEMATRYKMDLKKPQIAISMEASAPGRMYDRWGDVVSQIKLAYGDNVEINLIYNPNKDKDDPTLITDEQLNLIKRNYNGVRVVSETLDKMTVFLANQSLVLAADSGLSHIAGTVEGGPMVVPLYVVPDIRPEVWETNPDRMRGVCSPFGSDMSPELGGMQCTDPRQKRINQIQPTNILERVRNYIRLPVERPSYDGDRTAALMDIFREYVGRWPTRDDISNYVRFDEPLAAIGEKLRLQRIKTLEIPATVSDLYQVIFGRRPDGGGLRTYSELLRQGRRKSEVVKILLTSDEGTAKLQEMAKADRTKAVSFLYNTVLGRLMDESGRRAYAAGNMDIVQVRDLLLGSEEYRMKFEDI